MASLDPLPVWAKNTLHDVGELVDNPTDPRRTRSQFFEAPTALDATEKLFPIHFYMSLASDPHSYTEAMGNPFWEAAMDEEYSALMENQTWDLVPLPKGRKLVRCRWIFQKNMAENGEISKYKSRLVAKGYSQVHGIDYTETFAPVAKMDSIRLVLAIAASRHWEVHHMDVKSDFIHGDMKEEIYMEQPQGYVHDSSLVCRLKKSLYGLKQAPRAWYAKMDSFLLSQGFHRCKSDPNVYMLHHDDSLLLIFLYVDDLLITGSALSEIAWVKTALHDRFSMSDMGLLHYFLGLEVSQSTSGIKMAQTKYALDLLDRFQMTECKPVGSPFLSGVRLEDGVTTPLVDNTLYRQLVGSLLYLTHTHPDLSYAVSVVSRYMQEPHELHWKVAKRILRYVKGTPSFGIYYAVDCPLSLVGYTDSDWVGDGTDHKSTSGYVFIFGSGPLCWSSKKQEAISLSTTEAEYRGAVNAATQCIWLQGLLSEFGIQYQIPTVIFCDNQGTIQISTDLVQRQRTKHIEIHMHYIRGLIHDRVISLQYCPTEQQVADIFTKSFTEKKFSDLRDLLVVVETVG
jgi:hypothetical protein